MLAWAIFEVAEVETWMLIKESAEEAASEWSTDNKISDLSNKTPRFLRYKDNHEEEEGAVVKE